MCADGTRRSPAPVRACTRARAPCTYTYISYMCMHMCMCMCTCMLHVHVHGTACPCLLAYAARSPIRLRPAARPATQLQHRALRVCEARAWWTLVTRNARRRWRQRWRLRQRRRRWRQPKRAPPADATTAIVPAEDRRLGPLVITLADDLLGERGEISLAKLLSQHLACVGMCMLPPQAPPTYTQARHMSLQAWGVCLWAGHVRQRPQAGARVAAGSTRVAASWHVAADWTHLLEVTPACRLAPTHTRGRSLRTRGQSLGAWGRSLGSPRGAASSTQGGRARTLRSARCRARASPRGGRCTWRRPTGGGPRRMAARRSTACRHMHAHMHMHTHMHMHRDTMQSPHMHVHMHRDTMHGDAAYWHGDAALDALGLELEVGARGCGCL